MYIWNPTYLFRRHQYISIMIEIIIVMYVKVWCVYVNEKTFLDLSNFNLVITTLDALMPMPTCCPLILSLTTLSRWITYFLRYTQVTWKKVKKNRKLFISMIERIGEIINNKKVIYINICILYIVRSLQIEYSSLSLFPLFSFFLSF